mgnify:CR=1 FL=1
MSLYNIETHLSCKNYATDTTSLFRQYHLSVGELLPSCNDRHSALVYVAEGSLFLEWGCLPRRTIEAGTLFLAPMNLHVSGTAACGCSLIVCFFMGQPPLCDKYSFMDLQREMSSKSDSHLPPPPPQICVKQQVADFFWVLSRALDDGLNCIHFHKVKQEELCILLRGYHTPEELYALLHYVVGYSAHFKDFVYEYYKGICNVQDFASLANMSVRSFQRKFKAEFKRPAHEWLQERRAERVLHDLRNTNKTFAEIATDHGFSASSYLITFCKRYFGQTPMNLRTHSEAFSPDFSRRSNASSPRRRSEKPSETSANAKNLPKRRAASRTKASENR